MTRQQAIDFLIHNPAKFGNLVGFTKLGRMHNDWIKKMVLCKEDKTLQAHRGSYKTTCVSIALALIIILLPNKHTMFMRKTDDDVKEIIRQVKNILNHDVTRYFVKVIWGVDLILITDTQKEITTNLQQSTSGTAQLTGIGMGSSITGKHFDYIFTDDIVNVKDRISRAVREETKLAYQELQNVKNKDGGRIFNTGTPWHKEDCFTIMPEPEQYDCYSTGMISKEELKDIQSKMTQSLYAANYELRHVADEDLFFTNPKVGYESNMAEQGTCQIDAAYYGEDYTAFTICNKRGGKYYVLGKVWRKHVDDVEDEIIALRKRFNAGKIYCEDNADKGYLRKHLKEKGERVAGYHESMNKHLKITTYLKEVWEDVYFVAGTDEEYINQICDYNENAPHDDAPDSLSSIVRVLRKRNNTEYQPLWNKY